MNDSDLGCIALFGAAGAVGHALSAALDRRGSQYRVVGRDLEKLRHEFPYVRCMRADFLSGEGVQEAAEAADTIFYLAGAPYEHFERHPIMVRNALAAAQKAGVKRFIHIAPVYSYGPAAIRPVPESQPHEPNTRKGRWRLEQEQAVLDAGGKSGMRTAIVHLPDFYGPYAGNSLANYFIREALQRKAATFIGPLDAQREFVYVPDVAEPLLAIAANEDVYGRCWNLGAVAPIRARDFTNLVYSQLGTKPNTRSVPKIALQLFGLFNPSMRELAEMYYLYDSDFILDDSALNAKLGGLRKTPYETGVRDTLEWMKTH